MAHRRTWKDEQGNKCPSVTTVLKPFKNPDPLMYWAWNLAYEPLSDSISILEDIAESKKVSRKKITDFLKTDHLAEANYRDQARKAAHAGNLAHDLVEEWCLGRKRDRVQLQKQTAKTLAKQRNYPVSIAEKGHQSFQAFLAWSKNYKLKIEATELHIGVQPEETTRYGGEHHHLTCSLSGLHGTVDCLSYVGREDGISVIDWKTSKAVYEDYLLQIAAYGILWKIRYPDIPIAGYHLLRFDKEDGDFHHHFWKELPFAEEMYLMLLRCYSILRYLKKRAK